MSDRLFVHPSIGSIEELRGKRFAVRPAGPQLLFPRLWLKDQGLADDVEPVVCPENETGRWGHWKPVASGECHACFITDLYTDAPREAGLKELPWERYPYADGYITFTTTEGIVDRKRDAVQALVNAAFEASQVFTTNAEAALDVMREECLEGLRTHFTIPDDRSLAALYAKLVEGFSPVPIPTAEGIHNALRLQLGNVPGLEGFNPLLMWDLSFARAALRTREQGKILQV